MHSSLTSSLAWGLFCAGRFGPQRPGPGVQIRHGRSPGDDDRRALQPGQVAVSACIQRQLELALVAGGVVRKAVVDELTAGIATMGDKGGEIVKEHREVDVRI